MSGNYPKTVNEVLRDRTYNPNALRAVKALRLTKPWRGTIPERMDKLAHCFNALCEAYEVEASIQFLPGTASRHNPANRTVYLGDLSVVTMLHEFAHALLGGDERKACDWSINLFKRVFPRSFARCRHDRHLLRRDQ